MTEAWAVSVLRAAVLALLFLYPAGNFANCIQSSKGLHKKILICLILLPLAIPPLLPAYSYSAFSFNFQTQPLWNEIVYCICTAAKALPAAFLIYLLLPDPQAPSAVHCSKLLQKDQPLSFIELNQKKLLSFCVLFLLIFHEYEMASLMRIKHWTVVIFNAHAGGLTQSTIDSISLALLPLATSVTAVFAGIKLLPSSLNKNYSSEKSRNSLPVIIYI